MPHSGAAPQRRCFAACSGFRIVGPASRNLWGIWEDGLYPQRRCFAACSGFQIVGPATRNLWGDGRIAYAPQRRCPTAALLRSLQWVSDSRSRVAEHRGRWEVCLYPQRRCFAACSGFRIVGPAMRNLGGDGRFAIPHSGAASQLAVGF